MALLAVRRAGAWDQEESSGPRETMVKHEKIMSKPDSAHLRVDSFSILSNHRSFRTPDPFPWVSRGCLERRIPGKNGEGSARAHDVHVRPPDFNWADLLRCNQEVARGCLLVGAW